MNPSPSSATVPRPSACPGLLRIVPARDGGLCRVKLPGGRLLAVQARAIAAASERWATGVLELTNRANLQLRGVRQEGADALVAALQAAGLGPANPAADDVRNLLLSPSAGRDPQQLQDVRPLAAELLALLEGDRRLHGLSAKFALQLDGGEALARLDHPHDVWLSARAEGFVLGLAGTPVDAPLGLIPAGREVATVATLLHRFLDLAGPEQSRMRQLLAQRPVEELLAGLDLLPTPSHPRAPAEIARRLGIHPQRQPGLCWVGAQPALGRLPATTLAAIADLAERLGSGELHLTPWQGLLLPDVPVDQAPELLAALAVLDLTTDPAAPLARLIACTGSVGCAKGQADTKGDALRLAERLPAGVAVHLSGCPRSCALAGQAPHTLLAVAPGRYDLFVRDATQPGPGWRRATHLSLDEAAAWLARSPSDA
ncbi:precorrin-3B synthase [Pseudomonas oryzihabitans]|uniref:precorrin-3B synthase n=1 Tax=Pseudomonas oryzihabitans TaxID=47885 RepID=UPI00285DAB98|nr:precorrin-3B synthase [Pseudomonas psychrotolerans]MDR6678093.1 precorrin-3B synthase [Pseudomonas psychrotolerans]